MGKRPTKKYQFEKEDKHDLLQFICNQMQEKKSKDINHKIDNIMEERHQIRDLRRKLVTDNIMKHGFNI